MNNGVLCFANNNSKVNYILQAQELASRVRKYLNLPTSIVTSTPNEVDSKLFDKIGLLEFRKLVEEVDKDFTEKYIDKQRLIRAYSVYLQTGKAISEWYKSSNISKIYNTFFSILLEQDREKNYQNCENRFEEFINKGAIAEVKFLKDKNFDRSLPGFKCLGVNWILKYLEKEITLEEAILLSKRDTRRYVKRQLTWFRHNFNPDLILSI